MKYWEEQLFRRNCGLSSKGYNIIWNLLQVKFFLKNILF